MRYHSHERIKPIHDSLVLKPHGTRDLSVQAIFQPVWHGIGEKEWFLNQNPIDMKTLNIIAQVLIVIGALNWGLVGLFDFNLVSALFGTDTFLTNTVYVLVGLAGLYGLYLITALSRVPDTHTSPAATTRQDAHHARTARANPPRA